ncbi:MAG: tyrosine decarboxylase MfnA, partial [Thermoplasmata archaeon]|nr:tyrosine decarboxylase MfnA [Thermoplasmata archaeon]
SGRMLSPMYTTPLPEAVEAHMRFMESNLGNPGLYPGSAELERELVEWFKRLFHAPSGAAGRITSGGTESNITALWMAREATGKKAVVFSENGHFSIRKACSLLSMEPVEIPTGDDTLPDLDAMERALDRMEVAAVVGIAGTTEFGLMEPIEEMAGIAEERDIPLHVDAAFGGMVFPFLTYESEGPESGGGGRIFDFRLEAVATLSVDPHKMGMSTTPAGLLIARDPEWWDLTGVPSPYLTRPVHTGLLGTRASGAAAGAYAAVMTMGEEGYRELVARCMENTRYLRKLVEENGMTLAVEPESNVVVINDPEAKSTAERLRERGWMVSVTGKIPGIRIVVMPHVTREVIEEFVRDLVEVLRQEARI